MPSVLVGAAVGFIGALVGAGGGFLLMPVLLMVYRLPPAQAAAVSLVTVTAAALSGTLAHARRGRVDIPGGLTLAAFAIPGALVGVRFAAVIPAGLFTTGFGALLAALGLWMLVGGPSHMRSGPVVIGVHLSANRRRLGMNTLAPLSAGMVVIGGLASLFGIGGGPLMVPLLAVGGRLPVHRAAATAQLVIFLSSLAGLAGYVAVGRVNWALAALFSAGALAGAPLGAAASGRLPGGRLLQLLGFCLLLTGGRLLF
jgi:uncharacterized protein